MRRVQEEWSSLHHVAGSQRRRFSKFRLKNTADNFPATTDFDTSGEVGLDTDLARGSDTIQDASGIDTLDFSGTTTQVVSVNLSDAAAQVVNPALTLTLSAGNTIENVIGGALSDTLTGNSGDDVLSGRAGNDILIGGDGADQLTGGISEDLLLGGRYIYANDFIALDSLRIEWISANSFDDRVGHLLGTLAGGVHNGFTLTRSTVKEDSSADILIGGSGRDWYVRNSLGLPAIFRDTVTDADLHSLFTEIDT